MNSAALQADMRQNLGDYKSAATAYKRALAEAPAADLSLLEVYPLSCFILWAVTTTDCYRKLPLRLMMSGRKVLCFATGFRRKSYPATATLTPAAAWHYSSCN